MFGSKIRSWMENHIVRPRKKGNKNKNGNSNNSANTPNGHKGTSYQADSTIGSPARRCCCEVSPIQNNTTSRVGWQSPQDLPMSPKSDHYPYRNMVKSTTSPKMVPQKSSCNNLEVSNHNQYSKSVDSKTKKIQIATTITTTSYAYLEKSPESGKYSKYLKSDNIKSIESSTPTQFEKSEETDKYKNTAKSEIHFRQTTKLSKLDECKKNRDFYEKSLHSSQLIENNKNVLVNDDEQSNYGKILPAKCYDSYNANIKNNPAFVTRTDNYNNNNNYSNTNNKSAQPFSTKSIENYNDQSGKGMLGCRKEINRNLLRTNKYSHSSTNSSLGHQLSHVINSLSSPESAYSTGYSTDGTSPGTSYTPEYYINMRTGTHYFPKSVGTIGFESSNRVKYGLNKIEETKNEFGGNDHLVSHHRRTESFDLGKNLQQSNSTGVKSPLMIHSVGISPVLQKNLSIQNYKGFESPSPRQRCRIRTNPWVSNTDTLSSSNTSFPARKIENDSNSSSSGLKSSSDAGTDNRNGLKKDSSDSETSSSTEKDFSTKTFSPNTIRRQKTDIIKIETKELLSVYVQSQSQSQQDSDEDATLNEMMGKFDESYVYEKETDILSDSDPTDCCSDLDTGQDAEDEYDTDELLDIDFIDTGSIQETFDKTPYRNTGSCSYHNFQNERLPSSRSRSRKSKKQDDCNIKRKRKLIRRKKNEDSKNCNTPTKSAVMPSRGCRSVGGTPVSLRKSQADENKGFQPMPPITNRCNSMLLTEVSFKNKFLAMAESEKALLKADMEADFKYKQLIHEAETILDSLKNNTLRDTPVPSPRKICNPTIPTNKRVEILRNCEVDLKRELSKTSNNKNTAENNEKIENAVLNKRIEILKIETASVPSSPKSTRFSPRKTHISNFINQNANLTELMRRKSVQETVKNNPSLNQFDSFKKSPQLQLNGRILIPPKSPMPTRRRFRSQSPKISLDSDSDTDSEEDGNKNVIKSHRRFAKPISKETKKSCLKKTMEKSKPSHNLKELYESENLNNFSNEKILDENFHNNEVEDMLFEKLDLKRKPPLMTFRSVDMGHKNPEFFYCPQSEPLKRKIYTCSSTFEKIQRNLDNEADIPRKALLNKIAILRRERQAANKKNCSNEGESHLSDDQDQSTASNLIKRQLILDTIESLKRSLEDQSIELYEINDPE